MRERIGSFRFPLDTDPLRIVPCLTSSSARGCGVRKAAFGAGINALVFAATIAVGFLLTPFLVRTLGKPQYDVWCVVEAVLAYFTLLDLGVASYLMRTTARAQAKDEIGTLNRAASASAAVFLCGSAVVLVGGGSVLFALSGRLAERAEAGGQVGWFLAIMLVNLACLLPLSLFPAILDGLERFVWKAAVRFLFLLLRTIGMVLALRAGFGLAGVGVVVFATTLGEQAALALGCFLGRPGLRIQPWGVERRAMRDVIGAGVDAFLAMLAGRITLQTGAILVGLMLPVGRVTDLMMAIRVTEYAKQLLRQFTTTLTPGISALEARDDWAGIRGIFLVGTKWMVLLSVPVNVGLWCFGRPFLAAWVGPEFAVASGTSTMILAGTVTIGLLQSVAARVLYGLGRLRWFARIALIEGAVNLLLTLLLIEPYGIVGVAVAIAVPNLLASVVVVVHTMRVLEVPMFGYAKTCAVPLLANVVPTTVWLALGDPAADYGSIGLFLVAGLSPYAALIAATQVRWAPTAASPTPPAGVRVAAAVPAGCRPSGRG